MGSRVNNAPPCGTQLNRSVSAFTAKRTSSLTRTKVPLVCRGRRDIQTAQYTVFCSRRQYEQRLETYKGARLVYLDRDANGVSSIFYDYESMRRSLDADVMLILGVSGCLFLPCIRRRFKGTIITNIDGLEWKRAKWKWYAKALLRWSERQAVRYSDVVIGDNQGWPRGGFDSLRRRSREAGGRRRAV